MTMTLSDRAALVTGASRGLGLEIARAFVRNGADVFLCARDATALEKARRTVASEASAGQRVLAQAGDVSAESDVAAIGRSALEAFPHLQILVNNAGVYGPLGPADAVAWTDWIHAVQINLFGSVLMCRTLTPHFRRQHYGKIIQLSGGGATGPLPNISAYATSKAAVVRFAETIADELRNDGIDVNAVAPGALNTRMLDQVLEAGPDAVGADFYARALRQQAEGGVPLARGVDLCVFLASSASDGITGKLISAVWDPWEAFPEVKADLQTTDIYTLRRIVPRERGRTWAD